MKIGDTFADGGFTYEVIGIHELGYPISKRVTDKVVKPITVEDKNEPKAEKVTKTQINRLPIIELEKMCDELGIERGTGSEMKKAIISKLEI